jgi:uncharacterized protein
MTSTDAAARAPWFFVSDLHGDLDRYRTLLKVIRDERPGAVLLGGDLLPSFAGQMASLDPAHRDFVGGYLLPEFLGLRDDLGADAPRVLLILGNDDARIEEASFLHGAAQGAWTYLHNRSVQVGGVPVYGYSFVPPTPFQLKDWERYDVSRFVDPGCVSPTGGRRTVPVSERDMEWRTIKEDLDRIAGNDDLGEAVFLFHSPPYKTSLDRADLDGKTVDHAPLDVHVGSIAMRRFIKRRQPRMTLHGHVHEAARLTGRWMDRIGETVCVTGAHDGPELALVQFDPADPESATRRLC